MIDRYPIEHCEHASTHSFEKVVADFEAAVGSVEEGKFVEALRGTKGAADFEASVRAQEGSSGFMRFLTVDHGAWLARMGRPAKARLYTIGNPLIAWTMIQHDLRVGLHVPIRVMIYEEAGAVRFSYDLPSSLMSGLKNEAVTTAARGLDEKLRLLAERVTGAAA